MYGFSKGRWKYIHENIDFTEVFVLSKNGDRKTKERVKYWEGNGYRAIPYEDNGVSVGIYILRKEG